MYGLMCKRRKLKFRQHTFVVWLEVLVSTPTPNSRPRNLIQKHCCCTGWQICMLWVASMPSSLSQERRIWIRHDLKYTLSDPSRLLANESSMSSMDKVDAVQEAIFLSFTWLKVLTFKLLTCFPFQFCSWSESNSMVQLLLVPLMSCHCFIHNTFRNLPLDFFFSQIKFGSVQSSFFFFFLYRIVFNLQLIIHKDHLLIEVIYPL